MKKKLIILATAMTLALSFNITVCAQPETMPDGTEFDAEFYAQTYPDVAAVYGNNANMLYQHYVQYGKAEGRLATAQGNSGGAEAFDAEYYAQTYPDVVAAFGTDPNLLYQHYILFGKAEGRSATRAGSGTTVAAPTTALITPASAAQGQLDTYEHFNYEYYMRANDDVLQAVGINPPALYQHYVEHCQAEGRLYNGRTREDVTNELIQKYRLHVWNDFGSWFVYLGTSFDDLPPESYTGYEVQRQALVNRYLTTGGSVITSAPSEGVGGETLYTDTVYAWLIYIKPVPQGVKDFILNYGTPGLFYNHGYDSYFTPAEIHWAQN